MKSKNKARSGSREHEELAPPPSVIPWRVPPPGSIGDAWDELITLPPDPREIAAQKRPQRPRRSRRRDDPRDMVFRDWQPPIHGLVIFAWILVGAALLSTGPLYPAMGILAGAGLLVSGAALWAVLSSSGYAVGGRLAGVALGASILLMALDLIRPGVTPYQSWFVVPTASPRATLSFEVRMQRAEKDMRLVAETAWCASEILQEETTALGNAGVNHQVDARSEYFRVSTLALYPAERAEGVSSQFLFYEPATLPVDPFADDFRATYGVYLTERHVIVFSAGPNGQWSINPRRPVAPEDRDPAATLAQETWTPARGRTGDGDLILVVPFRELEALNCSDVRETYEQRALEQQ